MPCGNLSLATQLPQMSRSCQPWSGWMMVTPHFRKWRAMTSASASTVSSVMVSR